MWAQLHDESYSFNDDESGNDINTSIGSGVNGIFESSVLTIIESAEDQIAQGEDFELQGIEDAIVSVSIIDIDALERELQEFTNPGLKHVAKGEPLSQLLDAVRGDDADKKKNAVKLFSTNLRGDRMSCLLDILFKYNVLN